MSNGNVTLDRAEEAASLTTDLAHLLPGTRLGWRVLLAIEFGSLFIAAPLVLFFKPRNLPPLVTLWVAAAYCLAMLWADPSFNRGQLWQERAWRGKRREVLVLFAAVAAAVTGLVAWLAPEILFRLPRQHPALWVLVMVGYPLLSVVPQAIIYRAFLMHRYRRFLPGTWLRTLTSACAFSLMHIVFRNPVAVGLTFGGGILFAKHYEETRSLRLSSLEHALYGCFLFTVGLGSYFYAKTI